MPAAGEVFRARSPGTHPYVIVTNPAADGKFAIANFTTKADRPREDQSCVLVPGDHPFITHDTIIRYADAYLTDEGALRGLLSQSLIEFLVPVSPQVLKRIQEGALVSRLTPGKIRAAVSAEINPPQPDEPE